MSVCVCVFVCVRAPCIFLLVLPLTNKSTVYDVDIFFLLVTLLHVSMRKHHHQGVSLFIRKNLDLIDRK